MQERQIVGATRAAGREKKKFFFFFLSLSGSVVAVSVRAVKKSIEAH